MNKLAHLVTAALVVTASTTAFASTGEVSFTPTGLRLSVMQISLSSEDPATGQPRSQQVLYTCPHEAEADCLVDVTSQTELDAVVAQAGEASVQVGTYDTIGLNLCAPGKNGMTPAPGYVRGSFSVPSEGKTYVTDSDPSNVTGLKLGADADAEFTAIGQWSCSQKTVKLAQPVVVTKDGTTPITIVMDATFIGASTPFVSPGMGGCKGAANGQARGVCVSYPSIFPVPGDATPEVERFLVAHHKTDASAIDDTTANAYVGILRGATGGPALTAFVRPYYSETSAPGFTSGSPDPDRTGPGYFGETLAGTFLANTDGSVSFTTGGDLDLAAAVFPHFDLVDHVGLVETRAAGSWHYHAILQAQNP